MENQTIREQIFDALFDYTEKWGSICTEADCATVRDEICLRIDQSQFTADEAEEHINQEVEKRIKERMPSEEERKSKAKELFTAGYSAFFAIEEYDKGFRNRMGGAEK